MKEELYENLLRTLTSELLVLPDKPEETPENTLKALWSLAKGEPVSAELAKDYEPEELSQEESAQLVNWVQQRLAGVPLAHISGRQRFMGLELITGPEALIPRKETELLAGSAINVLRRHEVGKPACVIDVCTGAGNVAVAIAMEVQHAQIYAADLSEEAIVLAHQNCALHGLTDRILLHTGDLFEPFRALGLNREVDMITCNPPYISSAKVPAMEHEIAAHEPHMAFDGGVFGVNLMRRLISEAPDFIRSGGYLFFEVGLGQGPALCRQMNNMAEYSAVETMADAEGNARVIAARVT
ncbi:peptide chain release factor N(5)-glutamine methyltransferase [Thiolapillus sp.]